MSTQTLRNNEPTTKAAVIRASLPNVLFMVFQSSVARYTDNSTRRNADSDLDVYLPRQHNLLTVLHTHFNFYTDNERLI